MAWDISSAEPKAEDAKTVHTPCWVGELALTFQLQACKRADGKMLPPRRTSKKKKKNTRP
jgi:hypothetical protein